MVKYSGERVEVTRVIAAADDGAKDSRQEDETVLEIAGGLGAMFAVVDRGEDGGKRR